MSPYIPDGLRQQIRKRFQNTCAYCQTAESLTVAIFEIDHIVPYVLVGESTITNLCLACPTCNRFKGIHTVAKDPQLNENVLLFHPVHQKWEDHFAWNEDYSEIIGLTSTGRATIELMRMNRPQMVRLRKMWVSLNEHPPQSTKLRL